MIHVTHMPDFRLLVLLKSLMGAPHIKKNYNFNWKCLKKDERRRDDDENDRENDLRAHFDGF